MSSFKLALKRFSLIYGRLSQLRAKGIDAQVAYGGGRMSVTMDRYERCFGHYRTLDVYHTTDHVLVTDAGRHVEGHVAYQGGGICLYKADATFLRGMMVCMCGPRYDSETLELKIAAAGLKLMKSTIQKDGGRRVIIVTDSALASKILRTGYSKKKLNAVQYNLAVHDSDGLEVGVFNFEVMKREQKDDQPILRGPGTNRCFLPLADTFSREEGKQFPKMDSKGYDNGLYVARVCVGASEVDNCWKRFLELEQAGIREIMRYLDTHGAERLGRGYD